MKSSEAMIFAVMNVILVRASHRNREVTDSNPVEVLDFSGFSTQLQKLHNPPGGSQEEAMNDYLK